MEGKKYKLLIADDEYWTREKIRSMIAWEEYRIDFMPPAQDGEEVLQILEADRVDILITDINMPFLNGVELVKKVKEQYPEIVILVLSGFTPAGPGTEPSDREGKSTAFHDPGQRDGARFCQMQYHAD